MNIICLFWRSFDTFLTPFLTPPSREGLEQQGTQPRPRTTKNKNVFLFGVYVNQSDRVRSEIMLLLSPRALPGTLPGGHSQCGLSGPQMEALFWPCCFPSVSWFKVVLVLLYRVKQNTGHHFQDKS